MEIYILLVKLLLFDKMCGRIPSKILEHYMVNNAIFGAWWTVKTLLSGAGYITCLPFRCFMKPKHKPDPENKARTDINNQLYIEQPPVSSTVVEPDSDTTVVYSSSGSDSDVSIVENDDEPIYIDDGDDVVLELTPLDWELLQME